MTSPTDDDGAIAILVAAFAIAMFALAAIIVDLGDARLVRSEAQTAVDAAALSGADVFAHPANVPSGFGGDLFAAAVAAVKSSAAENFGTTNAGWNACSAPVPPGYDRRTSGTDCILFHPATGDDADRIQVVLPAKRSFVAFGGIAGYSGLQISASAAAQIRDDPVPACGLCVLDQLDTRGPVAVTGGDSFAALRTSVQTGGSVTVQPPGILMDDPRDPLATFGSPDFPTDVQKKVTCGPGGVLATAVYEEIDVTGSCTISGTIAVTKSIDVESSGELSGVNATIYLTCVNKKVPTVCSNENGGALKVKSGGTITITTLGGLSTPTYSIVATGNSTRMDIGGTVSLSESLYVPVANVEIGSGAHLEVGVGSGAGGRLVAGDLTVGAAASVAVRSASGSTVAGPPDVRLTRLAP